MSAKIERNASHDAGQSPASEGFTRSASTPRGFTQTVRAAQSAGVAVALTTNADTGVALWSDLAASLARLGVAVPAAEPVAPNSQPVDPPPGYAGRFLNRGSEFHLERSGRRLLTTIGGRARARLTCLPRAALSDAAARRRARTPRQVPVR